MENLDHNSAAVQKHIDGLQKIIERMAKNSASAKQWCVALLSAIFALAFKEDNFFVAFLALLPWVLFFFLDTYYLHLERSFIAKHVEFYKKLNGVDDKKLKYSDLFDFRPVLGTEKTKGGLAKMDMNLMADSAKSHSIYPFYGILGLLVVIGIVVLSISSTPLPIS